MEVKRSTEAAKVRTMTTPQLEYKEEFPWIHVQATVKMARTRAVSVRMGTERGRMTMNMAITAEMTTMIWTARVMDQLTMRKIQSCPETYQLLCKITMQLSMN